MKNISVLIPTYKPDDYIIACLQSIENQTLEKINFKVYIALNGPRDVFCEYLKKILEKFSFECEVFYLPLAGVSRARNLLIEKSVEDYIVFIDDDDLISENYLENLLERSSEVIMAVSNSFNFEVGLGCLKENYIGNCFDRLPAITDSKFKSRKYFSSPCAKLIHRNMIGEVRFDENLAIGEDSLFMARISNEVKYVAKSDPSACYYVYERMGSATRRKIEKGSELRRIVYLLKKYGEMLFSGKYEVSFILSRIVATLIHGKKLLV